MKIGLISINMFAKGLNFACPLHTFAFQQFLAQNGVETTVISYLPNYYGKFDMRHPADSYAAGYDRLLEKKRIKEDSGQVIDGTIREMLRIRTLRDDYKKIYDVREERFDKFQNFIDTNYIKTEEIYDENILDYKDPGFDCYICVTDVIWGLKEKFGFDRGFFLNCATMNGKYKIAYAASRGVFEGYTPKEQKKFIKMVKKINKVSVREEELKSWLDENTDIESTTVLDPVLLLDKDFWNDIAVAPKEQEYVLLYYVMESAADTIKQAINYAKEHNLPLIELSDRPFFQEIEGVNHIPKYAVGPEEWLGYIKNAKAVFTNSFHCCCFSIIFEKCLYVGKRKGNKVAHILSITGLSDRIFSKDNPVASIPEVIDYVPVKEKLAKKREESKDFILNAIKSAKKSNIRKKIIDNPKRVIKNFLKNTAKKILHKNADTPVNDITTKASSKVKAPKKQVVDKTNFNYEIYYHSGKDPKNLYGELSSGYDTENGKLKEFSSGTKEYRFGKKIENNDENNFEKNMFSRTGGRFIGWKMRLKFGENWVWYMKDGRLELRGDHESDFEENIKIFADQEKVPHLMLGSVDCVVVEAVWEAV